MNDRLFMNSKAFSQISNMADKRSKHSSKLSAMKSYPTTLSLIHSVSHLLQFQRNVAFRTKNLVLPSNIEFQ